MASEAPAAAGDASSLPLSSTAPAPASPTLTNPDMILPPHSNPRQTPSPPSLNAAAAGRMSNFAANKRRSALDKPSLGPRLPIAGTARPSMPGSWQTESDIHDPATLTRKTSVSRPQPPAVSTGLGQHRLSRTGSLRASSMPWLRTSSRERSESGPSNSSSSLLGPGTRRPTLAERLEEEDPPESPYTTTSESTVDEEDEDDDDDDDDIGTKAEEILANAKRRLTAMEGNLNRARSLSTTRGASPASSISTGDMQPRYTKRMSRSIAPPQASNSWAAASSKLRQMSLQGGSGHLRMYSETAASPVRVSMSSPQRSMSALGHEHNSPSSPAGMRTEWTDTSSSDSYSNGVSRHLEPLHEDEMYGEDMSSQPPSRASPLVRQASNASLMYQTPSSSTSTLSRARSNIALRDLQDGVGDLKDKVNQLKERTKRESMKRQSLTRLKTPSPFTNADSWLDTRDRDSRISTMSTDTAVRITESTPPVTQGEFGAPELQEPMSATSTSSVYSTNSNGNLKSPMHHFMAKRAQDHMQAPFPPLNPKIRHIPPTPTTPLRRQNTNQSTSSTQTSDTQDDEPISPSLSDAFPAPPATTPTPPRSRSNSAARSVRSRSSSSLSQSGQPVLSHEDNPDAFDYSRFLLDSAMGTYALDRHRSRSRSPSASSTGTQSTTRPRKNSERLSKMSTASAQSRASTSKRISVSPSARSRDSTESSGSPKTLAQRRASSRSNSSASLYNIAIPDGRRSMSPKRKSGLSDALPPPDPLPPSTNGNLGIRPGHTRQLSTDSISASSVASFATALERASSQLTIQSMSRSTLRNASMEPSNAVPTHRANLEAYDTSRNNSFASAMSNHSPPRAGSSLGNRTTAPPPPPPPSSTTITASPGRANSFAPADPISPTTAAAAAAMTASELAATKRNTQNVLNALLIDEADALRTPTSPTLQSLPANISKASAAILAAVLAVSHAAVREDDERRGIPADLDAPRLMHARDEAMLGRVLEGVLGAAVGLIGRSPATGNVETGLPPESGLDILHGRMGNSWRKSSVPGRAADEQSREINDHAIEQQRDIWRMRCEVARRALTEEKPGEGF